MIEFNTPQHKTVEGAVSIANIEQILPTPVASPRNKPVDIDDEIKPHLSPVYSVASTPERRLSKRRAATRIVQFTDEISPKRSRGRPPKTGLTPISPTELKRMNPTDRKYHLMRVKNNEASRRSRLNRKDKEDGLFRELALLERINCGLQEKNQYLDSELGKWQKKLLKLYTL